MSKKKDVGHGTPAYYEMLKGRAEKRFDVIDKLHPDVRAIVHEYGWAPVKLLMDLGAKRAKQILYIIKVCRGEDTA